MEKFGILNLLKALETLNPPPSASEKTEEPAAAKTQPSAEPPAPAKETHNVMASVLCRHEEIANRVKNNRR